MIILLSSDFHDFAYALHTLYKEPVIEFPGRQNWTHDLKEANQGEFIKRITIIGHGDSLYDDEQSFFGGNPNLNEHVMMIDQFTEQFLTLLKYNETRHPGFCNYLQHIDIIACHAAEKKHHAQEIAKLLKKNSFIKEHAGHLSLHGFVNPKNPKWGTVLMPHIHEHAHLTFYTFNNARAYAIYQKDRNQYEEEKKKLHKMEQLPGAFKGMTNFRKDSVEDLQKDCDKLREEGKNILQTKTHKISHIDDPRKYFASHSECKIKLSSNKPHHRHAHPAETQPSISKETNPREVHHSFHRKRITANETHPFIPEDEPSSTKKPRKSPK